MIVKRVSAYSGIATYFKVSSSIKKFPEQKHINMATMDIKREVKPKKRLRGKFLAKSLYWYLEVRRVKNTSKDVKEEQRASSDEIANTLKAKCCWKIGFPVTWSTPPGTVADDAKATVAIRAAMNEQELHVLLIHVVLLSKSSLCVSVKIWSGRCPDLFKSKGDSEGREFLTYCNVY